MAMKYLLGCLCVLLLLAPARAQTLETIRLQHRSAEQVLPQVLGFVGPGGMATGRDDMLFVRTSAANLAEIRALVASLDTPVRRLMITVRQDGGATDADAGAGVSARVVVGGGAPSVSGSARLYQSDRHSRRDVHQQVQTIDGGRAAIMVGQSLWLPLRQIVVTPAGAVVSSTLVQRDLGTGFVAMPRLNGERVSIDISPVDDTPGRLPGAVNTQRLVTTVNGRLGEWIELGGSSAGDEARDTGPGHYGTRSASRQRRLLLKVDALP